MSVTQVVKWMPDEPPPVVHGEAVIEVYAPGGKLGVRLYKPEHAGYGQTWVRRVNGEIVEFNDPDFVTLTPQGAKYLYPEMTTEQRAAQLDLVWMGIRQLLEGEKLSRPSQSAVDAANEHLTSYLGRRPTENELREHLRQSGAMRPVLAERLDPIINSEHLAAMREWDAARLRESIANAHEDAARKARKLRRGRGRDDGSSEPVGESAAYIRQLEAEVRRLREVSEEALRLAGQSAAANGDGGPAGQSGLVGPEKPGQSVPEALGPTVATDRTAGKRGRAKSVVN